MDSFDTAGKALTDPRIGEGFSKVVEEAGEGITKGMQVRRVVGVALLFYF